MAAAMNHSFGEGFLEDVEIWKYKTRIDNPLLTEEDGAVYQHRRWYEQFYVDVADVTPEMTARFELEVDTAHAFEVWQGEVDDNLAKRLPATADS
jgi:3-ketosteroid 9alpha-monooxygenase subunit A